MGGHGGSSGGAVVAGAFTQRGRKHVVTATTKNLDWRDGRVQTTITLRTRQNEEIGNITTYTSAGVTRVKEVVVAWQGKGLGGKLYRAALADAKAKGSKKFTSDFSVSKNAVGVWKSLGKTHKVRKVPTKDSYSGQIVAKDGKGGPVFSITLK